MRYNTISSKIKIDRVQNDAIDLIVSNSPTKLFKSVVNIACLISSRPIFRMKTIA